jgi:predicted Rossmann fold nucleotide-binding protein DprA/Smf involved in DNA uptake
MSDKEKAKERMEILKRLREERKESVARTQAYLKEHQAFRKQLRQAMKGGPKTIPEIAEAAQLPSGQVLWHVMAMKKYDLVREVGMDAEYYQYQLAKEVDK